MCSAYATRWVRGYVWVGAGCECMGVGRMARYYLQYVGSVCMFKQPWCRGGSGGCITPHGNAQAIISSGTPTPSLCSPQAVAASLLAPQPQCYTWLLPKMQVGGPLSAVFTPAAMAQYQQVFKLLWRLQRVQHGLDRSWSMLKVEVGWGWKGAAERA